MYIEWRPQNPKNKLILQEDNLTHSDNAGNIEPDQKSLSDYL